MMQYPPGASYPPAATTYSTVYVFSPPPAPHMAAGRPPPPSPHLVGGPPYAAYPPGTIPPPPMVVNAASIPAAAYHQFYHYPAAMVGGYSGAYAAYAAPHPYGNNNTATMAAMANRGYGPTAVVGGGAAHAAVMYTPSPMFGVGPIPSPPECGASPPPPPTRRADESAAATAKPLPPPSSTPLSSNYSATQQHGSGGVARSSPSSSDGRRETAATRGARSDNTSDFVPAGGKQKMEKARTLPSARKGHQPRSHALGDENDDDDDEDFDDQHEFCPEGDGGNHRRDDHDEDVRHPKRGMRQLIVNYLDNETTGPELLRIFAEVGKVDSARVMYDPKTNQPLGYGFVYFADPEAARDAVACMNGYPLRKKRLKVSFANPLKQTVRRRQRVTTNTNNLNHPASAKAKADDEPPISSAALKATKVEPCEFGGDAAGDAIAQQERPSRVCGDDESTSADNANGRQTEKAAARPSNGNGPSNSDSNAEGSEDSETSSAVAQRISGQKTEGAVREWTDRVLHDEAIGRVPLF